MKTKSRKKKVFIILLLIVIGGAAAGWFFREPLMEKSQPWLDKVDWQKGRLALRKVIKLKDSEKLVEMPDAMKKIVDQKVYLDKLGQQTTLSRFIVEGHDVILFSRKDCPFCRSARDYFQNKNIRYHYYNIEESDEGRAAYQSVDGRTLPVVVIGNHVLQGFVPHSYDLALKQLK